MHWLDDAGAPRDAFSELFGLGALSEAGEQRLFEHSPEGFAEVVAAIEAGETRGFDLPIELEARTSSRHTKLESPNVVGLLPGSDPRLREEYVVLTAHLDHLGVGDAVEGDAIYNGAYDNASGVASLLAVAKAFADLPLAPRRSLVFLAVTGEEKGLLGSDYFAANTTVPSAAIVANINLDMALMLHPLNDVIAFGSEHSTLSEAVDRATARLDLDVSQDPIPEEVFFIRSDQYSFVRRGIPALFVAGGRRSGDSALDGHELWQEWMRTVWHTPGDDMAQSIDFETGAEFARLNFLVVYHVANADQAPTWNPGDFFGERFAR
jgi:Zn-dependent M28 family amino/carboxypeptidase